MVHSPRKMDRLLCRLMTTLAKRYVLGIQGHTEVIGPERGPFILAMNHNQRYEALLIPALLHFYRQGKPIHFLADWQYMLMPGVASLYRAGGTIITTRKNARPRFLNVFKPIFKHPVPAYQRALTKLENGAPIGIFPEGTLNRDPNQLLRGFHGAARLALMTGVPVVPAGIRFPLLGAGNHIGDGAKMSLHIGHPLHFDALAQASRPRLSEIQSCHRQIMQALTEVSGKIWRPGFKKRSSHVSQKS